MTGNQEHFVYLDLLKLLWFFRPVKDVFITERLLTQQREVWQHRADKDPQLSPPHPSPHKEALSGH